MERIINTNLIRRSLGAIGFSLMTLTATGDPVQAVNNTRSQDPPQSVFLTPDFEESKDEHEETKEIQYVSKDPLTRLNLTAAIEIPYFFEDCRILDRGWSGYGTTYTEAGCVGCSPNLRMANGERLSDNKPTFATWRDDLNTEYVLENFEKGLKAKGRLTDRGGFDGINNPSGHLIRDPRLRNRTFDLSLALAAKLGYPATDKTLIIFRKLDCNQKPLFQIIS